VFDLYSARLIGLLGDAGVRFETFPAGMVDERTGQVVPVKYEVFHLLERYPVIDELVEEWNARHGYKSEADAGGGSTATTQSSIQASFSFYEPGPDDAPGAKRLMFRLDDSPQHVVVHKDLKTALEEAGITGCRYDHWGRLRICS
jgi:hypothetical protein